MRWLVMFASAVLLAAGCGGGGGGSSFQPGDASPTGIWEGVLTFDTGDSVEFVGMIAENGEAIFVADDGQMIWGFAANVNGDQFSANYEWALPPGFMTPGGALGGTGELNCTFVERVSIDCDFTSTSTANEVFTGTAGASYNDLYDNDSSLTIVAGDWLDVETGTEVLSIDAAGTVFSQDALTGCVLSGTMMPIDPAYNAYDVSLVLDGCTDPDLALANGTHFDGLGAVGDDLQPRDTLLFGIHGEFMGVPIAIRGEYRRM